MTPADVYAMTNTEYAAFEQYANTVIRNDQRAARKAAR